MSAWTGFEDVVLVDAAGERAPRAAPISYPKFVEYSVFFDDFYLTR